MFWKTRLFFAVIIKSYEENVCHMWGRWFLQSHHAFVCLLSSLLHTLHGFKLNESVCTWVWFTNRADETSSRFIITAVLEPSMNGSLFSQTTRGYTLQTAQIPAWINLTLDIVHVHEFCVCVCLWGDSLKRTFSITCRNVAGRDVCLTAI